MIDARSLNAWLGRRSDQFHRWMKDRIEDYGFVEGEDFTTVVSKTGGRPRTDYLLTLDMAKELAMVERTQIGRMTRAYFIEMEKKARETISVETGSAQQGHKMNSKGPARLPSCLFVPFTYMAP